MRDIEEIYRKSINPINSENIIKLVDIYSYSDDVDDFEENIVYYTDKSEKRNLKLKQELYDYLVTIGLSVDDETDYNINFIDSNDTKEFSLVLNTNYNSTMKLTKLFLKECIKQDVGYDIQFNIFGETDNSFMINCTGDNVFKYLNILNKLSKNYPNLFKDINEPGPLFSRINNKIGICSNNGDLEDFYKNRSIDLYKSIDHIYMNYISDNYDETYLRKGKNVPIINLLTYYVTDEIKNELNESKLSDEEYLNKYGFNKDFFNYGENFRSLAHIVKDALIDRFVNDYEDDLNIEYIAVKEGSIKLDDERVKNALRKASYDLIIDKEELQDKTIDNIYNTCRLSDIDKDNYAFDSDSVFKNNKVKTKKML